MMNCPQCQSENFKKFGKTKIGYQRYFCKACQKTWSDSPHKGRPSEFESPLSDAERAKRYREKKLLLGVTVKNVYS